LFFAASSPPSGRASYEDSARRCASSRTFSQGLLPQPMKSPPEADSIRHLRPIESATPSEGFEHR